MTTIGIPVWRVDMRLRIHKTDRQKKGMAVLCCKLVNRHSVDLMTNVDSVSIL